jgi:hypothetical protein
MASTADADAGHLAPARKRAGRVPSRTDGRELATGRCHGRSNASWDARSVGTVALGRAARSANRRAGIGRCHFAAFGGGDREVARYDTPGVGQCRGATRGACPTRVIVCDATCVQWKAEEREHRDAGVGAVSSCSRGHPQRTGPTAGGRRRRLLGVGRCHAAARLTLHGLARLRRGARGRCLDLVDGLRRWAVRRGAGKGVRGSRPVPGGNRRRGSRGEEVGRGAGRWG